MPKEFWCTRCGTALDAEDFVNQSSTNPEHIECPCGADAGPGGDVWLFDDALHADPGDLLELPEHVAETEEQRIKRLRVATDKVFGW